MDIFTLFTYNNSKAKTKQGENYETTVEKEGAGVGLYCEMYEHVLGNNNT
jgi:hypothetical protein